MQVGLREANMHFSKYIKLVKKGREIVLTERGVPIAAIRPVAPAEDTMEERLNALKDRGVLKRGTGQLNCPRRLPCRARPFQALLSTSAMKGCNGATLGLYRYKHVSENFREGIRIGAGAGVS